MKRHRFIAPISLNGGEAKLTDSATIHHICDVLKLSPGEEVVLSDGKGAEAVGTILSIEPHLVRVALSAKKQINSEVTREATLYLALIKEKSLELAVQKATEMGVARIVPILTARTVKQGVQHKRLEKIITEAAEQSGRSVVPSLANPIPFKEALTLAKENQEKIIFFDIEAKQFVPGSGLKTKAAAVFVGPEGGWDPKERALAEQMGAEILSFGRLVLRAETAAMLAVYVAVSEK